GDLTQAERHFNLALTTDPAYPEGWNGLGDILAMQQKFRQAAESYRAALRLKPDFAQARLSLGAALAALGQPAEARVHLELAARSSNPEVAEAARSELSHLKR